MGQIAFKQNGRTRMTTTKQFDYLNRLQSISSTASNTVSSAYTYNDANQRTRNVQADGSYWIFGYDFVSFLCFCSRSRFSGSRGFGRRVELP